MISDITHSKSVLYGATAAAGFLAIGYLLGKRQSTSWKKIVSKSYEDEDAVKSYCVKHSTPITDIQKKLIEFTLKMPRGQMLGAPEVISLNSALIMALKAKKVLDIGVFTGASSLGKKCPPVQFLSDIESKLYFIRRGNDFTRGWKSHRVRCQRRIHQSW